MRIIKEKTLWEYCSKNRYSSARDPLQAWIYKIRGSSWDSPAELKADFKYASIIGTKRVVFNVKGNYFRLIVDIEYQLKTVFIVWFGTHSEYDKIDVKSIDYGG